MRLFLGAFPDESTRAALARLRDRLERRPHLASARWVRVERCHLTLAFLGEQAESFAQALSTRGREAVASVAPFPLTLDHLGGFPTERRARVLWLGVGAGRDEIVDLAERCRSACEAVGIATEERPFRPHLTLARAGRGSLVVPDMPVELPAFVVGEVRLVHSRLGPGGGYDDLARWPLTGR